MKWTFKKDYRLLLLPVSIVFLFITISIFGTYRISFRLLMLLWSVFFFIYFYRLHVKKNLKKSVETLRFHEDFFQVLDNGHWLKVELGSSSLISNWLLALQWNLSNENKSFFRLSYSLIIFPSSMEQREFRMLVRNLQKR